jgi:hypothetical protein
MTLPDGRAARLYYTRRIKRNFVTQKGMFFGEKCRFTA